MKVALVARAAIAVAALIATLTGVSALAQPATIAGVWWTPERDGKIEIVIDDAATANGRLIAIAPDAADRDTKNPNLALRDRPVLGLTILRDFRQERDGSWSGGTVYDPETGSTYRGTLSLDGSDRLRMRGYIGISLFGRTEILDRVRGPSPAAQQPGEPELVYTPR
ncbi:MAG: DUF2147 domain-containing protein [Gemmatimonas sp.]